MKKEEPLILSDIQKKDIEESKQKKEQEIIDKFNEELKVLLDKHNVGIRSVLVYTEQGIIPQAKLVVLPKKDNDTKSTG